MKSMTCKQLGGACDEVFHAETFEEIAALSKKHGSEMYKAGDEAHITAIHRLQQLMNTPGAMSDWYENKRQTFEMLPEIQG